MLPVKPSDPRNCQGVVAVLLNVATWVQVNHSSALASRRRTRTVTKGGAERRNPPSKIFVPPGKMCWT